ncbi:MAG: zinc ribbon domain-containing protein [Kiritimatiellia bacterium]|nr:zinc ribbon domain-containing protein [Lentisphaerota bacterium]
MPIHEYDCVKCRRRFEFLARRQDQAPTACPVCGGRKLLKAFSAFSVAGPPPPAACGAGDASACRSCPSGGCPHSGL